MRNNNNNDLCLEGLYNNLVNKASDIGEVSRSSDHRPGAFGYVWFAHRAPCSHSPAPPAAPASTRAHWHRDPARSTAAWLPRGRTNRFDVDAHSESGAAWCPTRSTSTVSLHIILNLNALIMSTIYRMFLQIAKRLQLKLLLTIQFQRCYWRIMIILYIVQNMTERGTLRFSFLVD